MPERRRSRDALVTRLAVAFAEKAASRDGCRTRTFTKIDPPWGAGITVTITAIAPDLPGAPDGDAVGDPDGEALGDPDGEALGVAVAPGVALGVGDG